MVTVDNVLRLQWSCDQRIDDGAPGVTSINFRLPAIFRLE